MGGTAKPAVWKEQQCKGLGVAQQRRHCTHRGLHISGGLDMGMVGTLQPGWWEQGNCWGGEGQAQGQARRHHRGARGAAVVWGQPSEQECEPIHMGQGQFMSTWITSSKAGAAHQLPLLSYCNVLSTAKSHVIGHPKM